MVEEPVAGQVVVHPDHVGRAGGFQDRFQPRLQAEADQAAPERMARLHPPAEQVPAHPPPLVVEAGLVGDRAGGIGAAEILGLDQAGRGVHPANGRHGQPHPIDLVEQHVPEAPLVEQMRMPKPIEGGKAGRGQGFVDRRPLADPGVALGDSRRETLETAREAGIDQAGVARAGAVVHQAGDGAHLQFAQAAQALVRPPPVEAVRRVRRDPLPEHRIAQRLEAQPREQVEIAEPLLMAASQRLVEEPVADPVHRALMPAPQLQLSHPPAIHDDPPGLGPNTRGAPRFRALGSALPCGGTPTPRRALRRASPRGRAPMIRR